MTPSVRLPLGSCVVHRRVLPDSAARDSARSVPAELGRKWLVCRSSRRDTNRRRALLWAVPEYGRVGLVCVQRDSRETK
jgi:hypothetical protein